MKILFSLGIVAILVAPLPAAETPRVLLVVANGAAEGDHKSGYDFGELAQAHEVFERNGFAVDIATPSGGKAHTEKTEAGKPYVAALLANPPVMDRLERSPAIADVDASKYDALFLIGGSAAMFDFPSHKPLQRQIAKIYEQGGVVGAVCHGPAALVDVKLANGRYLVAGKRVSAFTEEEESAFGSPVADQYPFVLERRLRERKVNFQKSPMMMVQVSRDGRLVTGQNPVSTARAAEEVIRALGGTPKPRQPDRDETTILLIGELLLDRTAATARARFERTPANYDPRLIAIYGSYMLDAAVDDAGVRRAATLMELGGRHVSHPRVESALARAHIRLGDRDKARTILLAAAEKFPQSGVISKMLEELDGTREH
jgi:putative intracellular protease/amidase